MTNSAEPLTTHPAPTSMHNHCTLHLTTNNAQPLTTHPPPGPPGYAEKRLQKRARAQNQNKKTKALKVMVSMLVFERGRFLHSGFFYIVPKQGSRQLEVWGPGVTAVRRCRLCSEPSYIYIYTHTYIYTYIYIRKP